MKHIATTSWRIILIAVFVISINEKILSQIIAPAAYSSNVSFNYIRTWDATSPQINPDTLIAKSLKDVKQVTQYFDGLGRPIQTVVKQGSLATGTSAVDLVNPVVYDSI